MILQYENIQLEVRPDETHEWLLESAAVAEGYGVGVDAIYAHLKRNSTEFTEGKHYVYLTDNLSAKSANRPTSIYWTKKGVIRLGFFIKSERARRFRDWAEDLILAAMQRKPLSNLDIMQMWIDEQRVNEQRMSAIETQQNQLLETVATVAAKVTAVNDEFFTLAGYYQLKGEKFNLTMVQAQQTGKTLKRKSNELGYVVGNTHSERYGRVNTYHRYVLQVVLGF